MIRRLSLLDWLTLAITVDAGGAIAKHTALPLDMVCSFCAAECKRKAEAGAASRFWPC